jgi:hypothetical protein
MVRSRPMKLAKGTRVITVQQPRANGSSATVKLLGIRPTSITADHWVKIIESTREAVLAFLSNEENLKWSFRHGPIHVLING